MKKLDAINHYYLGFEDEMFFTKIKSRMNPLWYKKITWGDILNELYNL